MAHRHKLLDYDTYLLSLTFPLLLGMAVQFWDGVVLFDGSSVAMHADCCCEDECNVCDAGTWSSWSTATVSFSGTVGNGTDPCDSDECPSFSNASFDLTEKNYGGCYVSKTSGLPCQAGVYGTSSITIAWSLVQGTVYANLSLSFKCDTQGGTWSWSITDLGNSPVDCSPDIDFGSSPSLSHNCASWDHCDFTGIGASVTFS